MTNDGCVVGRYILITLPLFLDYTSLSNKRCSVVTESIQYT